MSGIKGKNTKPELLIRKALYAKGYRYRLHNSRLPGKPDLVLKKCNAVIFINGCFWHKHDCHLFKWPKSRPEFWRQKIEDNVERDHKNMELLRDQGWRIATIWECAVKGKTRLNLSDIIEQLDDWLNSDLTNLTIEGTPSIC